MKIIYYSGTYDLAKGDMAEWLTRRTRNLRIVCRMVSNPYGDRMLFP